MSEGLQKVRSELEECGYETYLVEGAGDEVVAFKYKVPTGRYRGKEVDIGLGMQETNYPEYPPHWIHVMPALESKIGRPGKAFKDAEGRAWVAFSCPPADFWDNAPTKHMSVYLRDHLRRFWRRA